MCATCNNNACGGCQPVIPQGLPGVNGKNAYTYTASSFTVPAYDSNVQITVKSTGSFTNKWALPGQTIFIEGAGYYEVISIDGSNQLTVKNPLIYSTVNTSPSNTVGSDKGVSPAGIKGDTGATGSAGTNGFANLFSDSTQYSTPTTGSLTTLQSFTLNANELVNFSATAADALSVTIGLFHARNTWTSYPAAQDYVVINYFGNSITQYLIGYGWVYINMRLSMASSSTLSVNYVASGGPTIGSTGIGISGGLPTTINKIETGINFTNPNSVGVDVYQLASNAVSLEGFYIDKIVA